MRGITTIAVLLGAAILGFACGDPPRRSSSDDDDSFITDTTLGSITTSSSQSGSGGALTGGPAGSGGHGATNGAGGSGVSPVNVGDLVITEIMNNPAAVLDADGEWFELHNVTNHPIDLDGFMIRHTAGSDAAHLIASSVVVPAGGYAVLARNGDYASNGNVTVDYTYDSTVSLHNAADYLAIARPDGIIVDETTWDELSGLDPDGASRSLDPLAMSATANDDDTNFCAATSLMAGGDLGTPGAANDACP